MGKRISLSELRNGLRLIVDGEGKHAENMEGDENPQIVMMRAKALAKRDLAGEILFALNGDGAMFRVIVEAAERKLSG